ncbi:MAG TPA: hypothetical protein VEF71_15220 [Streptosporangiaceae bacterium]|nr:hypothetical protein [Streptosporangiaceae bacterium]
MTRQDPGQPAAGGGTRDAPASGALPPATCKRPGCGRPLPAPGRGRTRQFCGDDCARRYHNNARLPAPADGTSDIGGADPLAALETLTRQAAVLIRAARDQAASLDPAHVRAMIADAAAAQRRAEATTVTTAARAAEAETETQALAEALAAARDAQHTAETTAQQATDAARATETELEQLRRDTREQITAAQAQASEQVTTARQDAARYARERDTALQAARDAGTEISRARQAETDARAETGHIRTDAARERDTLREHYQAQLAAASALTAAERARAERAEQQLETERADRRQLTSQLTGTPSPPTNGKPPAPGKRTRATPTQP